MRTLNIAGGLLLTLATLAGAAVAQPNSPGRDQEIEAKVTNKLQKSKELSGVRASVEDGVVNLAGPLTATKTS